MGVIGIELEDAISLILEHTKVINDTENLPLSEAWGRITAKEQRAAFDNPPFPRSPLDGYAFAAAASIGAGEENPVELPVIDYLPAGTCRLEQVPVGCAVRIMTGAPIPAGCDCVLRLEDIEWIPNPQQPDEFSSGTVRIRRELKSLENYCHQGEDFLAGALLLEEGTPVDAVALGMLASAGVSSLPVYRRLKAALVVTGDEILEPGQKLGAGKIYGSNLALLYGRMRELGVDVIACIHVGDRPKEVAKTLLSLTESDVDLIITTGGVSIGDKDIFHQVLPLLGVERLFWRVQLKPGTPMMFAVLNGVPMFHLSGNPFAAAVTFELLVRPSMAKMSRDCRIATRTFEAMLASDFSKESKQRRFVRATCQDGKIYIDCLEKHASGMLSSMRGCNCLVDVPRGTLSLKAGEKVKVVML